MSNKKELAEMIKSLRKEKLKEQESAASSIKKQWEKEKKPMIDIGGHAHDPSGPNKSHLEENEDLTETMGTATPLGHQHNPRASLAKKGLAGKRYKMRVKKQQFGNQARRPTIYEEIVKKVVDEKKKMKSGKTDTGKPSEVVELEPQKSELTTYN